MVAYFDDVFYRVAAHSISSQPSLSVSQMENPWLLPMECTNRYADLVYSLLSFCLFVKRLCKS